MEITTIGLDLAKNVFQVHAINSASEVVVKKTQSGLAPGPFRRPFSSRRSIPGAGRTADHS
jgi:transposase